MTVALYTNSISAHQLPLAKEIVKRVGAENFRYVYTGDRLQGGPQEVVSDETWIVRGACAVLDECDILLSGNRALDLFRRRESRGQKTYYFSERWFKPIAVKVLRWHIMLPGRIRLLSPSYRRMAKGFVRWLNTDPNACYLAMGPWAKKDMLKLGVKPEKIHDWGYFVEEGAGDKVKVKGEGEQRNNSALQLGLHTSTNTVKVLWVGRLLDWKRVDTIIRAIALLNSQSSTHNPQPSHSKTTNSTIPNSSFVLPNSLPRYTLTIIGDGPEKPHLQKLANHLSPTPTTYYNFLSNIPISQVREEMRKHDVYVLASNAMEGWGAALSEALSEGMVCFGTYEAGASAALLPDSQLFHSGDHKELAHKLSSLNSQLSTLNPQLSTLPSAYTPSGAAERLLS